VIYFVGFVVLVLATARLTRLTYFDDITIGMRKWIDGTFGPNSFISKMVWCPWCSSVWWSLGSSSMAMDAVYLSGALSPKQAILCWLLLIPAVAYLAGWLVDYETSRTSRGE
jgi:hypothetical protein